jgi:GMP synthase (glutamine-hydrolysing)
MSDVRLAFLNASNSVEMTNRNFRRELDADLETFVVQEEGVPETFDYDGAVVSGSGASVYWDEEWIHALNDWLAAAHERGMPVLGVCYGHQALAYALGGDVVSMETLSDRGDYEIGYRTVRRTGADPVLDGLDEEFLVFTTHGDTVTELPDGAEPLAENDYGLHAFRVGRAVGVQFHPEYDVESATRVTEGKSFDDERIRSVLDGITDENYAAACEAKALFDGFVDYARDVRERETASV